MLSFTVFQQVKAHIDHVFEEEGGGAPTTTLGGPTLHIHHHHYSKQPPPEVIHTSDISYRPPASGGDEGCL